MMTPPGLRGLLRAVGVLRRDPEEPIPAGSVASRLATILVVEDHRELREFIVDALKRAGHRVLPTRSAEAALIVAKAHEGTIHLLIANLDREDGAGAWLAQRLAQQHPDLRTLLTSARSAKALGVRGDPLPPKSALLERPFHVDGLVEKVRGLLEVR